MLNSVGGNVWDFILEKENKMDKKKKNTHIHTKPFYLEFNKNELILEHMLIIIRNKDWVNFFPEWLYVNNKIRPFMFVFCISLLTDATKLLSTGNGTHLQHLRISIAPHPP